MRASPFSFRTYTDLLPERQPPRTSVAPEVLYLALDHLVEVRRRMDNVAVARVDPHVGNAFSLSCFFEEDQVARSAIGHLPAVFQLLVFTEG